MRFLRRLRRDNRAVAMTEFALAAPLMLTAGLGGLEAANLAVTHMKISQAAMQIADNASRIGDETVLKDRPISETDIIDLLMGADLQTGGKLDLYKFGRVILSSLETDPADPDQQWIHWQRCMGEFDATSSYGVEGDGLGDPSFVGMGPAGLEVMAMPGDAVMFVEIVYEYQPIITDAWVGDRMIRAHAAFTVRDDRDLSQIHQEDPLDPVEAATCNKFERFRTDENKRKTGGGWNWSYKGGHNGGSSTTSSTTGGTGSGGSTTTTSSTSGGSTTTSGGTTTTSGGSTTTSGGTTTTSGGTTTTSGGNGSSGNGNGGNGNGGGKKK